MKLKNRFITAALVATISTQACLAALQAPLPQFKSKADLDKKAQASPQLARNADSEFFYTGKPFETEQDKFLFKHRLFDPEVSRWTSVDLSGFPDGANSNKYVNAPIFQLDPTGLATLTLTATWEQERSFASAGTVFKYKARVFRKFDIDYTKTGSGTSATLSVSPGFSWHDDWIANAMPSGFTIGKIEFTLTDDVVHTETSGVDGSGFPYIDIKWSYKSGISAAVTWSHNNVSVNDTWTIVGDVKVLDSGVARIE